MCSFLEDLLGGAVECTFLLVHGQGLHDAHASHAAPTHIPSIFNLVGP